MAELWRDIRFGLRTLAKNPGFTAVAVLTLALGIGANAAIFSILDPLLLRKLPVKNPDELVLVHAAGSVLSDGISEVSTYIIYRDQNRIFSGVLAVAGARGYPVTKDNQTSQIDGEEVSGTFFDVLGVNPFRGRMLAAGDSEAPSGNPVVVLSFDYWRTAFNGDESIIGKTLTIRDRVFTIIGVAPPGFFGVEVGSMPSFYIPIGSRQRANLWVAILARLKQGISLEQAKAGLEPVFEQAMAASTVPEIEKQQEMSRLVIVPAAHGLSDLRSEFSLPAKILMGVVGMVLLIACSNVASLLFARSTARRKEITIRLALGAGRWRLVRQLLTESALLVVAGSAFGLIAASWISRILIAPLSTEKGQIHLAAGVTGRVLIFTAAALILTVLFCGLAPALAAIRGALANDLRMQGTGRGATAHSWLAQSPVVIQVALSVAVLAGAGLLLHSLYNLETKDIGFDRDNVVAVNFTCCRTTRGITDSLAMESEILTRARNLPGVRSASFSSYSQTSRRLGINVAVEGAPAGSVDQQHVFFNFVSPGYFETMGIPILVGRDFRSHDDAGTPMTAVINRTMAHHYFGDTNPIGRRFTFVEGKWPPFEIIGVAADSVYNDLREETPDFVYVDHTKFLAFRGAIGTTVLGGILNVRANGRANSLSRPLMDLIRSFDTAAVVQNIRTLREQIDLSLHRDRLIAALCSTFSLLALVLTCIGLYGTLSFSVARRTNEIGVRMALGASPHNIFTLVIGQGIRLTIIGLFVGAAGAIASGYLLASLLFGVKRADPVTLAGVALLLLAAAVLACYVPARRAMGVNPLVALRDE